MATLFSIDGIGWWQQRHSGVRLAEKVAEAGLTNNSRHLCITGKSLVMQRLRVELPNQPGLAA